MSILVMNILDEMDAERERRAIAESIEDYGTEWDEYVSEYEG